MDNATTSSGMDLPWLTYFQFTPAWFISLKQLEGFLDETLSATCSLYNIWKVTDAVHKQAKKLDAR